MARAWINYIVDQHTCHSAGDKIRASKYVDVRVNIGLEITRTDNVRLLLWSAIKEDRKGWLVEENRI